MAARRDLGHETFRPPTSTRPAGGNGLGGLDAGAADKLRREGRGASLRCVGLVMQFHAVETGHIPSHSANAVGG